MRSVLYHFMKLGYLDSFKISKIKGHKDIIETYSNEEIALLLKKPKVGKCIFNE